jgi:hypothetical protein
MATSLSEQPDDFLDRPDGQPTATGGGRTAARARPTDYATLQRRTLPLTIADNTPTRNANLGITVRLQMTHDRTKQVTTTGQVNVI